MRPDALKDLNKFSFEESSPCHWKNGSTRLVCLHVGERFIRQLKLSDIQELNTNALRKLDASNTANKPIKKAPRTAAVDFARWP